MTLKFTKENQQKLLATKEALRSVEREKRALEASLDAEDEYEAEKAKKTDDNGHLPDSVHFGQRYSWLIWLMCFFFVLGCSTLLWTRRNQDDDL